MSEVAENGTVTIVLLRPLVAPNGTGSWAPGERAGFEPEIARDLVARGAARFLTDAEQRASAEIKKRADTEEYAERVRDGLPIPTRLRHLAAEEAGA